MKLNPFRRAGAPAEAQSAKPVPVAPAPRHASVASPPRVWSLLLPPGYTDERRTP